MQTTHECNGEGLQNYPDELPVKAVNVFIHDSGMISTHDYSCPCCRSSHAVLDGGTGIMQPCWGCQDKGYKIIKKDARSWLDRMFK